MSEGVVTGPPARRRRHLPAAERERMIIEGATRFFAARGFEGQTRDLARGLGITHSAIFRYFPTKEALIDRVYEHVYVSRWNPDWAGLIQDRSQPLEARLVRFYREYAERIFDYDWVRIFIHSGLKGTDITPRYLTVVRDKLIRPVCAELRASFGLPDPDEVPLAEREEEAVWALHGKVFYLAIRRFIYGWPVPDDVAPIIADDVRIFLRGAPAVIAECCRPAGGAGEAARDDA
ncbi:transcriptional regulator, TetR family [Methylobacterium sp. 4-46]|uniref:TetR/AcrR family transcriptional regulator n=1 Tax=unclassified Methylobacterium TaxID=2615210 RepID=UPI000152D694|nr:MULTISPECIES: TetR/AcrR family transcriptional regulator [Methylobacterium]ACA15115.1 transcriptional regulator, TetR family [Methylobacterium sp. 4-46]WFT80848.1 TetR/AcrR family transcriptional regulator [Methylobacterium nodulans]